jgi:hypothetical protein
MKKRTSKYEEENIGVVRLNKLIDLWYKTLNLRAYVKTEETCTSIEYKITELERKFSYDKFKLHEAHLVEMGSITYSRYYTMDIKGNINKST